MANPNTPTVDYSTWADIINPAGTTGAYLEQMSTGYATIILTVINRVSRAIDMYTQRRFYRSTGDETRTWDGPPWRPDFSGTYGPYAYASFGWAGTRKFFLSIPVVSITSLQLANGTNDAANNIYTTINSGDFYLEPSDRMDFSPAQWLELSDAPIGTYSTAPFMWFSPGYNTVKLTGKFGWDSTDPFDSTFPPLVRNITVEETVRWFKSRDASFSDMTGISDLTGPVPWSKFLSARSRFLLDSYRMAPLA